MTGLADPTAATDVEVLPDDQPVGAPPGAGPGPRWFVLLPVFLVAAVLSSFPSVGRLDSHVVGNSGDAILVVWILGWVQHAIPLGWDAVWNTSMYHPAQDTLAYSDSMLSTALLHWPLRLVFGPVLATNLLMIGAQTATFWFTYRLALRLSRSWIGAFVAALMFGLSTPLLVHISHLQLMLSAFLIPLTLLLLVRYLHRFAVRDGVGVGLALVALVTSATYYALVTGVAVAVVVVGYLAWYRPRRLWVFSRGLVAGAALAGVLVLPVALQYSELQDDPHFRRAFDANSSAHLGDFLSVDGASYVTDELPVLDVESAKRGIENHLYPGLFAVGFGVVGVVVVARGLSRRDGTDPAVADPVDARSPTDDRQWASRMTVLLGLAGLAAVVLAFGDQVQVLGQNVWLPMKAFRKLVPGFSGMRATSRFVIVGQLALVVFAAFGIRALLTRVATRAGAAAVLVVVTALVVVESARSVPYVDVPDSRVAEGVGRYLEGRPDGVVVELPIRGIQDGAVWAYTESPRLYVSLIDANDRVNGYSGYTPPGFDATTPVMNTFPSPEALALLDERDVRYVVLRTAVLGEQLPPFDESLRVDGVGRFTPATARARIAEIPPERVKRVERVPGAWVVELRPPR